MDDVRPAPASNLPEFTVTEISGAVKRTLEDAFGRVRVRGEITELKRYPSGHFYFSLKDEGAKLRGIIWKTSVPRLGMVPEDGVEVIATGRLSTDGKRSDYALYVDKLEYAGVGALLARIERLRVRLADEGLFAAERKRALPHLPRLIGVVTSPSGAVIHDIRTTIARRFPRDVLIWPVPVQGNGAAERIAAAIAGFGRLAGAMRPDVLIVARGGGSLEDLMAFNEEIVVRAAADCAIPLISAVGHETDTTLIDFASDRRAPTPTAAAELAVPVRAELLSVIAQTSARLSAGAARSLDDRRLRVQRAGAALPDPAALLGSARQRLDDRALRLDRALPALLATRKTALVAAERRLPDAPSLLLAARARLAERADRLRQAPPVLLAARRARLDHTGGTLPRCLRAAVARIHGNAARTLARLHPAPLQAALRQNWMRAEGLSAHLEAVSPLGVLARGYALVSDASGVPITRAADVPAGAALRLRFADGEARATTEAKRGQSRQGSLGI